MNPLQHLGCGPLSFDFSKLMVEALGPEHGVGARDLADFAGAAEKAREALKKIRSGAVQPHGEKALFLGLPYQGETSDKVQEFAMKARGHFENVVSVGIGGSYLGNKLLHDALAHPHHNSLSRSYSPSLPRVFWAGENVDPAALKALFEVIVPGKTLFVVISKSGGTMEPLAATMVILEVLKKQGLRFRDHVVAITDPAKGFLKGWADSEKIPTFIIPDGIGGRFTALSESSLLTAALAGLDTAGLLEGARAYDQAAQGGKTPLEDPALAYALLHHILHKRKGKNIGVLMPYASSLKTLGDWYVQLLAESLGKEKDRTGKVVYAGRTPLPALGTTDMHAQTQQHREGENNRVLTFIRVKSFGKSEIELANPFPGKSPASAFDGRKMGDLLAAALAANEASLADAQRPSCRIEIGSLSPQALGALILFFETATAYEGELLDVNAFDQPGVEDYKKRMQALLHKPS